MLDPYIEKETRWNKIRYISKFFTNEAAITLEEIIREWPKWSEEERCDFIFAFIVKNPITEEDVRIIEFLLLENNSDCKGLLPFIFTNFPDPKQVSEFIERQIRRTRLKETNTTFHLLPKFYEALETFGNSETIPLLKEKITEMLECQSLYEKGCGTNFVAEACVAALKALYKLEPKDEYRRLLEGFKLHPNNEVVYLASFNDLTE